MKMRIIKTIGYVKIVGGFAIGLLHFLEQFSRDGWTRVYADQVVEVVKSTAPGDDLGDRVFLNLDEFRGKIEKRFQPSLIGPTVMLIGGIVVGLASRKKQASSNQRMDGIS